MSQFSEFSQAAVDYNSTLTGALELSEKTWVLAVQLAGVDRHSRHVLDACGERLVSFVERLKARCGSSGRKIARVILTHEAGRDGFWLARSSRPGKSDRYADFVGKEGRIHADSSGFRTILPRANRPSRKGAAAAHRFLCPLGCC